MLSLFAVICPPLAVALTGKPKEIWFSLLLTVCFWVPGVVYAFRVIKEAGIHYDTLHSYEPKSKEQLAELSYSLPRIK